jgi:hypothetical protein
MGKEASSKKKNVPASIPKPTADQRGTKNSPLVVDTEGHQDTPAETEEKAREKEIKDKIDSRTLLSVEITAGATVILMFVGIGGVCAALRTLNAILRQVALQELTLEQWVDYGPFKSEYVADKIGRQSLFISVDLLNPSNFPVTLPDASIVFELGLVKITSEPSDGVCRLLPNKPHRVTVRFDLTADQAEAYAHGAGFVVGVSGNLAHIGTLKERHEQPISGRLRCHEKWTIFEDETRQNDNSQDQPAT